MSDNKMAQAVDALLDGVPQLIADAERYRKALERIVSLSYEQVETANHQIGRMRASAESALEGQPVDGDAERYKRERDEAVGLLREACSVKANAVAIENYEDWQGGEPSIGTIKALGRIKEVGDTLLTFLARIEQDDFGKWYRRYAQGMDQASAIEAYKSPRIRALIEQGDGEVKP